jgi:hypothetical protein
LNWSADAGALVDRRYPRIPAQIEPTGTGQQLTFGHVGRATAECLSPTSDSDLQPVVDGPTAAIPSDLRAARLQPFKVAAQHLLQVKAQTSNEGLGVVFSKAGLLKK